MPQLSRVPALCCQRIMKRFALKLKFVEMFLFQNVDDMRCYDRRTFPHLCIRFFEQQFAPTFRLILEVLRPFRTTMAEDLKSIATSLKWSLCSSFILCYEIFNLFIPTYNVVFAVFWWSSIILCLGQNYLV